MTIGEEIRNAKKKSILREISYLKSEIRGYLNTGDYGDDDVEIVALKKVLEDKKRELEYL